MTLYVVEQGAGRVRRDSDWTLELPPASRDTYSNAMLTSYRSRADFTFGAGTQLSLTAHAEGDLRGTAGFGFWNHPYGMGYRLPRAVWFFFGAPPNDMPLAMDVPGHGFKAGVFDAQRLLFYALLPFAPIAMLLVRVPALYRLLWPIGQRAIGVDEISLDQSYLSVPRRYGIRWSHERVTFSIDETEIFATERVPAGRLGFVAWVDNQYAVVTPQGRIRFGLLDTAAHQRLILSDIHLSAGAPRE